jgi:hypothetical protein
MRDRDAALARAASGAVMSGGLANPPRAEATGFVRGGMLLLDPPHRWHKWDRNVWRCGASRRALCQDCLRAARVDDLATDAADPPGRCRGCGGVLLRQDRFRRTEAPALHQKRDATRKLLLMRSGLMRSYTYSGACLSG